MCDQQSLRSASAYAQSDQSLCKVSKGAKIRNRYNQVPHLTQDTNGKVTNSQLDTTNESKEVSPFPAGDHKTHINRRAQRHNKSLERSMTVKLLAERHLEFFKLKRRLHRIV